MTQAPAHSPIGGSGYYRWKNCLGSVRLQKKMDRVSTSFADDGTEAHDLACAILVARSKKKPEPDLFGYEDDMVDHVLTYVDHMISIQRPGCVQLYEHRFHLKKIHPLLYGTADGITYYPDEKLLVISDLKYGAGVYVDVERNDQLLYYATGAVLSLPYPVHKVRIEIIQPRIQYAEAIRPWECDIFDILEFADELEKNALATEDPDAPLCAGDWCQFCPVSPSCPLLRVKAKVMMARHDATVGDMAELADDYRWLPILESMIKRKREYAYAQAEKGVKLNGLKLVKKKGRLAWKDEDDAGGDLRLAGMKAEQIFHKPTPPALLSPTQIKALPVKSVPFSSKKELHKFVDDLATTTTNAGHKLVLEEEDGEAVVPITAKTVFSARRKEIAELT